MTTGVGGQDPEGSCDDDDGDKVHTNDGGTKIMWARIIRKNKKAMSTGVAEVMVSLVREY